MTGRLEWVDINGRRLSSCEPDGQDVERHSLPGKPASFAQRRIGGRIIAYRNRIALLDDRWTEKHSFVPTCIDMERERFNDGACDLAGRFWVGTIAVGMQAPVGGLYRVDPDLSVHRMDSGFAVSNGIAWSPTADRLYHCDTHSDAINVHDFDLSTGEISGKRLFARLKHPDGCATDDEGGLWVAQPGHSQVVRLDPDGAIALTLPLPVRNPSSVTFGGPGRRELFVTSIGAATLSDPSPHAGCLLSTTTRFRGLPSALFAG